MEILRKPPYPLTVTYSVPDPDADYFIVIEDYDRFEAVVVDEEITSNSSSEITYTLSDSFNLYDEIYSVTVYEDNSGLRGEVVVEDNLNISRPYVDPASFGHTTSAELEEYTRYELLARSIVDSITDGFYFTTDWIETTGQGTDYLPLWNRVYKILEVYENTELVYDSSQTPAALGTWNYVITQDKTAITKDPVEYRDVANRHESKPLLFPFAASDSITPYDTDDSGNSFTLQSGVLFGPTTDYVIKVETGYRVIPEDIKQAIRLLVDDFKCGRLDYYKRSIVSYSTDQYRIQMDKASLQGTGNIMVDKILSKYVSDVKEPRVL